MVLHIPIVEDSSTWTVSTSAKKKKKKHLESRKSENASRDPDFMCGHDRLSAHAVFDFESVLAPEVWYSCRPIAFLIYKKFDSWPHVETFVGSNYCHVMNSPRGETLFVRLRAMIEISRSSL